MKLESYKKLEYQRYLLKISTRRISIQEIKKMRKIIRLSHHLAIRQGHPNRIKPSAIKLIILKDLKLIMVLGLRKIRLTIKPITQITAIKQITHSLTTFIPRIKLIILSHQIIIIIHIQTKTILIQPITLNQTNIQQITLIRITPTILSPILITQVIRLMMVIKLTIPCMISEIAVSL
jgi:hypothetical protein